MWYQSIDPPLGCLPLSALVAALPIVVFLLCLVAFKLSGIKTALIALAVQVVVALAVFGMPASAAAGAGCWER